ncbi:MAG: SpoIIE family protein phosphatase [Solobacterium sp.]|nr:SpoIIE family protein phosphatase [Solobacterium sp.]
MGLKERLIAKIREEFLQTTETLWNNEIRANLFTARAMLVTAGLTLLFWILSKLGFFSISNSQISWLVFQALLELIIPAGICIWLKGERKWLKLLLLSLYTLVLARIEMLLTHNMVLSMAVPVLISVRYYSRTITSFVGILTIILTFISNYLSIVFHLGRIDMNMVTLPAGTVLQFTDTSILRDVVISQGVIDYHQHWLYSLSNSYIPKLIIFGLIIYVCTEIAGRGREAIFEQQKETKDAERLATELHLAKNIQSSMLPEIFPPFPEHQEFDVYASMRTAREVGGDFYDFYMIDDDHMAMLVADVSGKGIPAAMFMMASKIMINNMSLLNDPDPARILEMVNKEIAARNTAEMFVTVWLGILEISTGKLTATNAGHEYPFIRQNGKFNIFKEKHGFVLGGMENTRYENYEIQLDPGDAVFVYTDGVTEAKNSNGDQFGVERLEDALNDSPELPVSSIINHISEKLDKFVDNEEQFDDITMVILSYNGVTNMNKMTVEAIIDNIPEVTAFVESKLEEIDCPTKIQNQIDIAIDELFSNIAKYAYTPDTGPATVKVEVEKDPLAVIITFIDHGQPYDPLTTENPNLSLPAEKREIGGLGIYLVKKTMDDIDYEYKNGQNILRIKKEIQV